MIHDRSPSIGASGLRIAMLAPFAVHGPKGTTRWRVMPLARSLAALGHTVRVVVPPYDSPAEAGKSWLDQGVEVVNLKLPRGGAQSRVLPLVAGLVRETAAWQPDVIHSFKPKGYTGLAAAWLTRRGYVVVQDSDDWEAGWNVAAGYPRAWQQLFARQERCGLRDAAAVTVAGRWLERFAIRLRGDARGVFYLPNGIEMGRFGSFSCSQEAMVPPLTLPHSIKRVLLYTRFGETTPAAIWRVWSMVLAQRPAAQLVVVGDGSTGEGQALARLAAMAGASHGIVLLGWQPPQVLPGLLASMDGALFPVLDSPLTRAKSPMRLLDVLAAGVPAATQAVGEYGSYVVDGETGLLTAPGDATALAAAVVRLLDDVQLARRLGAEAARRTAVDHAWPRLAEAALAAYDTALRSRGRKHR